MSGTPTMQGEFFESGLGGVLRVANVQTAAQVPENRSTGILERNKGICATHVNSKMAHLDTVNLRRDRRGIILGCIRTTRREYLPTARYWIACTQAAGISIWCARASLNWWMQAS